ncbi:dihydrofolate reductase family protein [Actinophytocola sp.]|uniref:dihydrofolate reductase family protein n=1 Tax=Actinophytocola sp. TaxID=1872138 RepID=UPI00389A5E14
MRKLIELTHVSLGGEIDSPGEWGMPYLDDDHFTYSTDLLLGADALLLGRRTYEGLSAAYPAMDPTPLVTRMNTIPKYVASRTLTRADWNATVIDTDVVEFVSELKSQQGKDILKYGNGALSATLLRHNLIDEFHLLLTPVAVGRGHHLFEELDGAPALTLAATRQFASGVLALVYTPAATSVRATAR